MNPFRKDSMNSDSTLSPPHLWQGEDIPDSKSTSRKGKEIPDAPPSINSALKEQIDRAQSVLSLGREDKDTPDAQSTSREDEDIPNTKPSVDNSSALLRLLKGPPGTKGSPAAPVFTYNGVHSSYKGAQQQAEKKFRTAPELSETMEKLSESVDSLHTFGSVGLLHSQEAEDELRKLVELMAETRHAVFDAIAQYEKMEQTVEDGDIALEKERSRCHQQDIMISFLETAMDAPDLWELYKRLLDCWAGVKGPERAHAWVLKALVSMRNELLQQQRTIESLQRSNEALSLEIAELEQSLPSMWETREGLEKEKEALAERLSNALKYLEGENDRK